MPLHVENQSRIEREDLDRAILFRLGDNITAGGRELLQGCTELTIRYREHRRMVKSVSIKIEIESRVDSALSCRNAKRSHIQHDEVVRYFIARVMPHQQLTRVVGCIHG